MTEPYMTPVDADTYFMLQDIMGEEFAELVGFFREDTEKALSTLQQAITNQDFIHVGGICHKLKSSSQLVGALELAEIATALEDYKQHHNPTAANQQLVALASEYARVAAWLDLHPIH